MLNVVMLVGTVKREAQEIMNGKMQSFMLTTWNVNQKTGQRYETHHVIDVLSRTNLPPMHVGSNVAIRGSINRRQSEKDGVKTWFTSILAFEVTVGDAPAQAYNGAKASTPAGAYPPVSPPSNEEEDEYGF